MWENGSSRAPNFDVVRRTPFATARILPWRSAQQGDDPVCLAELVRAKHYGFVAIGRHLDIVPDVPRRTAPRAAQSRRGTRSDDPGVAVSAAAHRIPAAPGRRRYLPRPAADHVAIVMDGNGRWAKARDLPRTEGHARGEASLFDVIEGAIEIGVKYLSAYAFSTENWSRSPDEVRWLMGFNRDVIRRRRDQLDAMGVRVRWAGRRPRLWRSVISELEDAEQRTVGNDVLTLQFCVNYGGRAEIVDAARRIAELAAAGRLDPAQAHRGAVPALPRRARTSPTSTCSSAPLESSGRRTSCSGRARTRSWSSLIGSGPTSIAATCGGRSSCMPPGTGAMAGRCPTCWGRSAERVGNNVPRACRYVP